MTKVMKYTDEQIEAKARELKSQGCATSSAPM